MRILLVHNKYQIRGGEDKVFELECELLKSHGHEVETLLVDNASIKSFQDKVLAAFRVNWSRWGMRIVEQAVTQFKPDVVHVHNFFPLLSPSIFSVFKKYNVPCVMTLHNYRIVCPTATFIIDGKVNEQSLRKSSYRLVFKKFYKNSIIGSILLAHMVEFHKARGTWKHDIDMFIALTEFARNKFIESGIPENKITVKPNFIENVPEGDGLDETRYGALFVGRISPEKGVNTLLRAWDNIDYPLTIAGGGVTEEMIASASPNVNFLGNVEPEKIPLLMNQASFLIMPSECYEGFPLVLVEAYCNKLPIIASDIGSLSELIIDGVTGYKYTAGDVSELRDTINDMINNPELALVMGNKACERANDLYSMSKNYDTLLGVYNKVITGASH